MVMSFQFALLPLQVALRIFSMFGGIFTSFCALFMSSPRFSRELCLGSLSFEGLLGSACVSMLCVSLCSVLPMVSCPLALWGVSPCCLKLFDVARLVDLFLGRLWIWTLVRKPFLYAEV